MEPFGTPSDTAHNIWSRLANWPERYSILKVYNFRHSRASKSKVSAVYTLFWSFEISDNILRNQKWMIGFDSYSRQVFIFLDPISIYISLWVFKPPSNFLLTVPRRHFCCGSYLFVIIFIVLRVAWLCGHSKTVRIALCIVFCFVQASTVTTSLQQVLTLLSVWLNVLFCVSHFRSYYSLFLSYNRSWGRGWVPIKPV